MLKRTRSFLVLSLAIAAIAPLLFSAPSTAQAQYRHVFIEEFTGNWCGWCPRGIWGIEQLKAKYGDSVIAIAIHGGSQTEPMQTAVGNTLMAGVPGTLSSVTAVQSFPNSWVNRQMFSVRQQSGTTVNTWNLDPGSWTAADGSGAVDSMIGKPALATVSITNLTFDPSTRVMTATVNGKFLTAMTGDFRFSLYITEDSVTGPPGSNYDQHNYYSGTSYDPTNPWTDSASVVPGYAHMHVLRALLGGAWGTSGIISSTVSVGGTYSQTFTYTVPAQMNPAKMHVIGTLHQYNATDITANQVFDAAEVPLTQLPTLPLSMSFPNGSYVTIPANGTSKYTLAITNNSAATATVALTASSPAGIEISGWSSSLSSPTVSIPAHSTADVDLNLTAPANSGFVSDTIFALPSADGYVGNSTPIVLNALSNNTVCAIYYSNGVLENAAFLGVTDSMKNHTSVLPLIDSVISNYPPENFAVSAYNNIPMLDNGTYYSTPTVVNDIQAALDNGKKVFINSDLAMYFAFDPNGTTNGTGTQDVLNLFARLGLSWISTELRFNQNTGAATAFSITGTTDPIGSGLSMTNRGAYGLASEPFSIDSNSTALFYFDGNSAKLAGARYEDPVTHGKLVYLGFDLSNITAQSKADTAVSRSINWLLSTSPADVHTPATIANAVSASPNPFHGMTQIQYVAGQNEHGVSLEAYDVMGREVAKLATQNTGNNYTAFFDGSKLANGTYVIVAHSTTGTHEVRVVNQQ